MVDSPSTPEEIVPKRPHASRPDRKRVRGPLKAESARPPAIKPAEQFRMSIKTEVALWRAFLGDEIDTILRDKD